MRRVARFALGAFGVGLAASCDAEMASATPDARTPFTEQAIRSAALALDAKVCAAMATCDPIVLERTHGGMDACLGRDRSLAELATLYGYGSTLTPETVTSCATALDLSTCEAYVRFRYESDVPEACRGLAYGALPEGSACKLGSQCDSGRCFVAIEPCGRCAPRTSTCLGEGSCDPGSTCIADAMGTRCVAFAERGESCNAVAHPCHPFLVCNGTCMQPGPSCDPRFGCSAVPALRYCNPETKACEPLPMAQLGEACGARTGLPAVQCATGSACGRRPSGDASSSQLVCVPRIEDGKACDARLYIESPCRARASTCSQNVCQRTGPAECSPPPVLP